MKQRKRGGTIPGGSGIRKDWYFDGWEREAVPRTDGPGVKKVFVYRGEYYGFGLPAERLKRLKLAYGLLAAAYVAIYLIIAIYPFRANHVNYVGIPLLLQVAPAVYFLMGIVCLLIAKEKMIIRSFYGSVRRIRRSLWFSLPLSALTLAGDIVFVILNWDSIARPMELCFTAGAALNLGILAGVKFLQYKFPCYVTQGAEVR